MNCALENALLRLEEDQVAEAKDRALEEACLGRFPPRAGTLGQGRLCWSSRRLRRASSFRAGQAPDLQEPHPEAHLDRKIPRAR